MRVLLISPYSTGVHRWMPLGLPFMAAVLRHGGHTPAIFDRYARQAAKHESLAEANAAMLQAVRDFRPDLIGLSTISQVIYDTVECAALLRTIYPGPLLAGGYHATALPELTLQKIPELDGVVTGEGEVVLAKLADSVPPTQLGGVWWRAAGDIHPPATPAQQIVPLDDLPFPAYDLMDMGFYTERTRLTLRGHNLATTTLITSRGCFRRCRFCAESLTYGRGVRFHSAPYVLEWMQCVVADYGLDGIHFHDNDFLADEARTCEICEGILRAGLHRKVKWSIQARADRISRELARLLKTAGCTLVEIGVEAGTQAELDQIGKGTTVELNTKAVALCRQAGLAVHAYMLTGVEGETIAELEDRLNWVKRVRPSSFQWSELAIHPGTPLYHERGQDFFAQSAWTQAAVDAYYRTDFLSALPASQKKEWMRRRFMAYMRWRHWWYLLRSSSPRQALSAAIGKLQALIRRLLSPPD
jgi:anaerobic magnesium-protoporphyrin IX monomethyl ester cyclase